MIDTVTTDVWYDPFKATGNYFNQFPEGTHMWAEITEGRDFLTQDSKCDIICSNPPYSMLDAVFKRCIELNPRVVSLLIGVGNLTARRLEWMDKAGYSVTKIHMCKVYNWFGMSFIVQFEKESVAVLTYDRTVWRDQNPDTIYNYDKKKQKK